MLATLAGKAVVGNLEQNKFCQKKLPLVEIEPGILGLLWHNLCYTPMPSSLSQLGIACKTETFRI